MLLRTLLAALAAVMGTTVVTTTGTSVAVAAPAERAHVVRFGPRWYDHVVHDHRTANRYLRGTPRDFRRAMARFGAADVKVEPTCEDAGVTVEAYQSHGYATGGVGGCGGARTVWMRTRHGWRTVMESQDDWSCQDLHRYRVPSSLVGTTCLNYRTQQTEHYHQR